MKPRTAAPVAALLAGLLLAGCTPTTGTSATGSPSETPTASRSASASQTPTAPPAPSSAPSPTRSPAPTPAGGLVVASGHGWTPAGLEGTVPAPGTCHIRWTVAGEPLPDPACTPGAIDAAVQPGTTEGTVCRAGGYTSSVRPPVSLTGPAKRALMLAYGLDPAKASGYELDHLVPLELGGASDVRNLWPEPDVALRVKRSTFIANDKDATENAAHSDVCAGRLRLDDAQRAIASDWTALRP